MAIPCIVVVLPLATILWAALLPYYQPFSIAALPKLGFANFVHGAALALVPRLDRQHA